MKNINKDFKYRDRRRPKFSPTERGLILAMLVTAGFGAAVLGFLIWIIS